MVSWSSYAARQAAEALAAATTAEETRLASDSKRTTSSLEAAISRYLWEWAFADSQEQINIERGRGFSVSIQFYVSWILAQSRNPVSRDLWCDLIEALVIERTTRLNFTIAGNGLSPGMGNSPTINFLFELEFDYATRRSVEPSKVIARIGRRGPSGELLPTAPSLPRLINRPIDDESWALVLEVF